MILKLPTGIKLGRSQNKGSYLILSFGKTIKYICILIFQIDNSFLKKYFSPKYHTKGIKQSYLKHYFVNLLLIKKEKIVLTVDVTVGSSQCEQMYFDAESNPIVKGEKCTNQNIPYLTNEIRLFNMTQHTLFYQKLTNSSYKYHLATTKFSQTKIKALQIKALHTNSLIPF